MNKNIRSIIPSGAVKSSKVDQFGNPSIDTRKKKPTFVDGEFSGKIYEVNGKYQQAFTEDRIVQPKPVPEIVRKSEQRLKELRGGKKERSKEELLFSYEFQERDKRFNNDYEIQVSRTTNNYGMTMLKFWKMYWTDTEGWKHTKQGFVMPVKEGRKMLRELLQALDNK